MGTAATTVQEWIEACETLDALEYGVRSVMLCRSAFGASPAHCAQITAGCQAATRVLGRFVAQDRSTLYFLKQARKLQREAVKAAEAEKKAIGTARQIKLALAA